MVFADLVIQLQNGLGTVRIVQVVFVWASFVLVFPIQSFGNRVQIRLGYPRYVGTCASGGSSDCCRTQVATIVNFCVGKKEKFVLDDRTTQGKSVLGLRKVRHYNFFPAYFSSSQVLVAEKSKYGAFEGVGTRFGYSVHRCTRKTSLAYIIRCKGNGDLFDGIQ